MAIQVDEALTSLDANLFYNFFIKRPVGLRLTMLVLLFRLAHYIPIPILKD